MRLLSDRACSRHRQHEGLCQLGEVELPPTTGGRAGPGFSALALEQHLPQHFGILGTLVGIFFETREDDPIQLGRNRQLGSPRRRRGRCLDVIISIFIGELASNTSWPVSIQ